MWPDFPQILRGYQVHEVLLEMAIIWIFVFLVFRFLRGTRGAGVIKGLTLMLVVLTIGVWLLGQASDAFGRIDFIYQRFFGVLAIFLIVVFQPELRQAMIRLGYARWFRGTTTETSRVADAVTDAVEFLSKSQFGALIAIERDVQLGGVVEGGQALDAKVSPRLLQAIFWPSSPLHDLGVVIREDRIVAAGVQFPLAEDVDIPEELGSRHRAAIGLSMETDAVVVIVSEETGSISIAERGRLEYDIPREKFRQVLEDRLRGPAPAFESGVVTTRHKQSPQKKKDKQAA